MTPLTEEQLDLQSRVIDEARSWIGTPWQHQQELKGYGVDCVHFIKAVAESSGVVEDVEFANDYKRRSDGATMVRLLQTYLSPIPREGPYIPTDVLAIRHAAEHFHCMIVSEIREDGVVYVIHASESGVREHRLDLFMREKIHSAYRLKQLASV